MNLTAISSVTRQSEPVYSTGQALNVNAAIGGQATTAGAAAAVPMQTVSGNLIPLGYQQITGPTTSTALTVPTGARIALLQAESQSVRWRDDGTAPTAAIGMQLLVGPVLEYDGNLSAFRVIQTAATAILNVSYYK
ncbi:hypothetical protein [Robbsia andropogonis]|nr:hypothetical protein [Robbsia andropogonis]